MKKRMLPGGQLGEALAKAVDLNSQRRLRGLLMIFESQADGHPLAYMLSIGPDVAQRMDFVGCIASASACAQRWNYEALPGEET